MHAAHPTDTMKAPARGCLTPVLALAGAQTAIGFGALQTMSVPDYVVANFPKTLIAAAAPPSRRPHDQPSPPTPQQLYHHQIISARPGGCAAVRSPCELAPTHM